MTIYYALANEAENGALLNHMRYRDFDSARRAAIMILAAYFDAPPRLAIVKVVTQLQGYVYPENGGHLNDTD